MLRSQQTAISLDAVSGWVCTVSPSFRSWDAETEEVELYGQTLTVFLGEQLPPGVKLRGQRGGKKCCAVHFLQENIIKISKDREQLADNWLYGREVVVANQYLLAAIKTKSGTDTWHCWDFAARAEYCWKYGNCMFFWKKENTKRILQSLVYHSRWRSIWNTAKI